MDSDEALLLELNRTTFAAEEHKPAEDWVQDLSIEGGQGYLLGRPEIDLNREAIATA